METRPQFLILSIVLAFLGTAIAWYEGFFHFGYALLAALGILLTHISVNTLNDYFDYKSGLDLDTKRTPFSGGSGFLPSSILSSRQVFWLGTGSLLLAIPIGVFFMVDKGWQLIPLLVVAGLCIVLYTPVILKTYWPEWAPGLGLGILPVLGLYFIQTGEYTLPAFIASVPSGILVHNLLLINEFPDVEADRKSGRKTTPITIGMSKASIFYSLMTVAVYIWVIAFVIADIMPVYCLLALLTLPFAIKAIRGSRDYNDMSRLVPAMANNVLVVLLTQLLLGIGYILARAL
jgi:1,4-dihydroxy-2-naphthoate octaprenyltransferase